LVDSILEGFGDPVVEVDEKEFEQKLKKISPFDFANSINHTKEDLIVDERTEKEYNPFIVNRAMGFGKDTIIAGNEMNARPHLDNKLQYDFLRSVVRKAKRYNKWLKAEEENIEAIQEFFGYSFIKAKEALSILTETEIDLIKLHLNTSKGGKV
jgi:hypothetical protein|tara:strand:- start:684 stop:1145 length:462 start_codon:yes stop_codon:yes gene_type:complete